MSTALTTTSKVTFRHLSSTVNAGDAGRRRWLILATICTAVLMIVLDVTVMNLALPSAQHALGFTNADRQWVVTAYALSFGSLLLFCGRLADLIGRKATFLAGLAGFAAASAVGGASVSFTMLVTARACQGAFAALLAPSALSLLTTTFTDPKERGKAFGVYGTVAASGSALGLLLGGVLTSYASWRWCLYVNLVFAVFALTAGALLLGRQPKTPGARLDVPGVAAVSGGMFCLVYGFSNAAAHSWHTPSTWGFLGAGALLLIVFALWQARATHPLLPPRVILDRNRGGAYLTSFVNGAGIFGIFLFLIYYMQVSLGYSPVISGVAMLPMVALIGVMANVGNIKLMPRVRPQAAGHRRDAVQRGRPGLADQDRRAFGLHLGPARPARRDRCRHGLHIRRGGEHRHLRRGPTRRRGSLGERQHRAAARRRDRHRTAQLDRRQLPGRPPARAASTAAGRARGGPQLHHGVLVLRRHLRGRRRHLRRAAAPRSADPPRGHSRPRAFLTGRGSTIVTCIGTRLIRRGLLPGTGRGARTDCTVRAPHPPSGRTQMSRSCMSSTCLAITSWRYSSCA